MRKIEKPEFRLQKVYSDGSTEKPELYELKDIDADWTMGRRGFLITSALGLGLVGRAFAEEKRGGTGGKDKKPEMPKSSCGDDIKAHRGSVGALSFSPDGKILASGSSDKTIKLWDMPSGSLLKTLTGHTGNVNALSFSPDGKILASGSSDKTIKLWNMPSGSLLKTLTGHTGNVYALSFSPDGKILASGSWDNTIKLWNMPSGSLLKTLTGHTNSVGDLSFSPDGKILASGSYDNTIKLWDMPSGSLLKTLTGHTHYVGALSFSPDGKILASGSWDNTIKLWKMPSGKFITCLFDPKALETGKKANQYTYKDEYGRTIAYTLPCGSPIPPGAICTCNCVPGSYVAPSSGGGTYCTCDKICTCIPIK